MNAVDRHDEIRATSAALRAWSEGLRAWSRATREASAGGRQAPRPAQAAAQAAVPPHVAGRGGIPALEPVPVRELRDLLVHAHGFSPARADRALAAGMLVAGYPVGYDRLAAADAFALVEDILRQPRPGPHGRAGPA
jgi:hypothetical protein